MNGSYFNFGWYHIVVMFNTSRLCLKKLWNALSPLLGAFCPSGCLAKCRLPIGVFVTKKDPPSPLQLQPTYRQPYSSHKIKSSKSQGLILECKEEEGCTLQTKFSSVQSLSRVRLFVTPWIAACQASLSITNSWSSPKLMSIKSVMPSSHLILCHPLFLLPSIPPSIRVFSNESTLRMRWPKYWSFSFSISPSIEHPGLAFFRMDWLDLLAVQGTLKSLLQHHSSKASILRRSAFFTVQLS